MEKIKGLAPHTGKIFEGISKLECIKPFVLVGGTALSLQIHNRQSEDLDFMRWKEGKSDKLDIGWPSIETELKTVGHIDDIDILGLDQVIFIVEGVKVSFYAAPRKRIPTMQIIPYMNNLCIADVISIGIMKMETMMRRSKFRDYYDIYSILINGADIMTMIPAALEHSGYKIKTKNLLAMLTNGELFQKDEGFEQLSPVYDVSAYDIQEYLKSLIEKSKE